MYLTLSQHALNHNQHNAQLFANNSQYTIRSEGKLIHQESTAKLLGVYFNQRLT